MTLLNKFKNEQNRQLQIQAQLAEQSYRAFNGVKQSRENERSGELRKKINDKRFEFDKIYNEKSEKNKLIRLGTSILNPEAQENEALLLLANKAHYLPLFLRRKYICKIDQDSRIAIIKVYFRNKKHFSKKINRINKILKKIDFN